MKNLCSMVFLSMFSTFGYATRVDVVIKDVTKDKVVKVCDATLISPSLVVTSSNCLSSVINHSKKIGGRTAMVKTPDGTFHNVEACTVRHTDGVGWLHLSKVVSGCSVMDSNFKNYEGCQVDLLDGSFDVQVQNNDVLLLDKPADLDRDGEGVFYDGRLIGFLTSGVKLNIAKVKLICNKPYPMMCG